MSRPASLRWRLLGGVLCAVALLWLAAVAVSYVKVQHELDELLDAHLAQSAALLVAQTTGELDEIEMEHLPGSDAHASRIAVQIWEKGRLRLHSANTPDVPLSTQRQGFSTTRIDDVAWRVYSMPRDDGNVLVQVGEPVAARRHLARAAQVRLAWPLLLALPLIGVGVWLAVGRGLRPLQRIAAQVGARHPLDVTPIGEDAAPGEIRPLLDRLNALFARIGDSVANERRFVADASHELRTPMAAIRAQAQVAAHARDERERAHALARVIEGSDRATRLIEQLLTLSRLDATAAIEQPRTPLVAVAREVMAELAPEALARGVALAVDVSDDFSVACEPTMLQIVLRNLVDNAIRHGREGGHVVVEGSIDAGRPVLCVSDDGPGIAPEQRGDVLKRFHRLAGQEQAGAGLGLAIVERIATVVGAELGLQGGPDGRGLRVTLRFPR